MALPLSDIKDIKDIKDDIHLTFVSKVCQPIFFSKKDSVFQAAKQLL
jgi:hypothetical protein